MHKTNDDGYCYATAPVPPSAAGVSTKPPHDGRPPQVAAQRNGYGHYQTAAGADEAGRKASNDVRRGPAAAKYAPEKPSTVSWTESKPKLEKDPQGRALNPDLGQGDAEKLFRDHVKDLYERCVRDFRALLSEVITPEVAAWPTDEGKTAINSWSEAKCLLRSDPRYNKLASKDREYLAALC